VLDEVTRRSLELTCTLRDGGRDGSLLAAIDRTVTPMGARLLHDWLLAPLPSGRPSKPGSTLSPSCSDSPPLRQELRERLGEAFDLQRLTARVSTVGDAARLGRRRPTLRLLPRLKAKLTGRRAPLLAELERRLELCPDLRESLDAALADDRPLRRKKAA